MSVFFSDISYVYGPEDDPQARLKHVRLTIYDTSCGRALWTLMKY